MRRPIGPPENAISMRSATGRVLVGRTSDLPKEVSLFPELLYIRQNGWYARRAVGFGGSWSEDLARKARDRQRNCRFALRCA